MALSTGWPAHPLIYEVNTAVWLAELTRAAGRPVLLGDVRASDWDSITPDGVDAVWLMGVWERSPAGVALAKSNASLVESFRETLADLADADIVGSPYCVRRYVVDRAFGGPEGLAAARSALADRGVRLMLDYVPNHVSPDHPWASTDPGLFVQGTERDLADDPAGWISVGDSVIAHGRDPYFPAWPDVIQLNAFAPALRAATVDTLVGIADQCDGIRCDMAMLMVNRVFAGTWGSKAGPTPSEEFWPHVIAEFRRRHADTVLAAEAYWDMEAELQEQGFDFCYDKRLYDRLVSRDVNGIRAHLGADLRYQSRLLRFLENHDEPRIASCLPRAAEQASAVAVATVPGATLWHEGQFEGRRVRPSVFLARRPDEAPDRELGDWYRHLLATVADHEVRRGTWRLLPVVGWPDNQSCTQLLAWSWGDDDDTGRHVVVVNFGDQSAQGRVLLGWVDLAERDWHCTDLLRDEQFVRRGEDLAADGLFVDLSPWHSHLLSFR